MNRVLAICARHWHFLTVFNLLIIAVTAAKIISSPQSWAAKAQLVIPNTSGNLDANLGTLGSLKSTGTDFSNVVDPLKEQQSILTSNSVLKQVFAQDPHQAEFAQLSHYKKLFAVAIAERSTTLDLSVNAPTPELARQRTIAWIEAYQQRLNELRQADNNSRQQFNQQRIEAAQQKLQQAETESAQFRQNAQLVSPNEQTSSLVKVISDLTYLKKQAQVKAQAKQRQVEALANRLNLTPAQAIVSLRLSENQDYQYVRSKLIELETNLAKLRATLTDQDPRIQALLVEREKLQNQLQQYISQTAGETPIDPMVASDSQEQAGLIEQLILLESEAQSYQQEAEQLQVQIDQFNETLASIPANQARLTELERQTNIAEGVYQGLVAQVQQGGIDSFNAYPNVQVVDPPEAHTAPSNPDNRLIILSAVFASVLGSTALLLLLESRNPLISSRDLQAVNLPILVCIPRFRRAAIATNQLSSTAAVEFEKLASVIKSEPRQNRRFLITSSTTEEGKTTVTLGLAKAFADLGFKVLLVDGDYRKADLSQSLGDRQLTSDRPIQIQPNLDLLATVPQQGNIAALVSQGEFERSLAAAEASGNYDYIFVDTPPVSLTSETIFMSAVIPNLLFVIRPGFSQRNCVINSLEQLTQQEAQILGLVVNDLETHAKPYSYHSHHLSLPNQRRDGSFL